MIVDRKAFVIGLLLSASFLGVLALIFSPVFDGRNGLQYADDIFNRLSKGSSYFIPKVAKTIEAVADRELHVAVRLDSDELTGRAATVLAATGLTVSREGTRVLLRGRLDDFLRPALRDAEDGFRNDGAALLARHHLPERVALATWWQVLHRTDMALKLDGRHAEASAVRDVLRKAIEPAHNYYGIEAEQVGTMAGIMTALLVFYVLYTVWWGYAIFFLFEGLGLAMKRKA
jgi:hypothetical protein